MARVERRADFLVQAAGNERDRVVSLFMANRALV
jgi:hypothetical protein